MSTKETPERVDWSKARSEGESLIGKFFFTFNEDGRLEKHGEVIGIPHPDYVFIQFFDWLSGSVGGGAVIPLKDVANNWIFYADAEDLRANLHRFEKAK